MKAHPGARFEMPEPALDFPTFAALIRLRSKAVPARAEYLVQQQAEESHESSHESGQPCGHAVREPLHAPADEKPDCSRAKKAEAPSVQQSSQGGRDVQKTRRKSRTSILEGKKAELIAKRVLAAQQLSETQSKLAEVQDRVEKLNEDKHELVIRLKQALQQEGSLKKQATLGSFTPMSPRADQSATATADAAAPLVAGDCMAPQQMNPAASPMQALPPSRREPHAGPGSTWSRDDEGELIEEGEVIPSPKATWPEVHGGSPVNSSSAVMRNSWLPPHLQQSTSGLVRTPSWTAQQQALTSTSQLPPHLPMGKRQSSGSFQPPPAPHPQPSGIYQGQGSGAAQAGSMRPRQGHAPPPVWGNRDGGAVAARHHGPGTLPNGSSIGRRGQYPY